MSTVFYLPKAAPLTSSGTVYPGAKAYFYITGTTTPKDTFNNADLAPGHEHENPVEADAGGRFPVIYLDISVTEYRLTLTTAGGVLIYTVDNVGGDPPFTLTQDDFDDFLADSAPFERTAEEVSASVIPQSFNFLPGDPRRIGTDEFANPGLIDRDSARFGGHTYTGMRRFLAKLEEQVDGAMAEQRVHFYGSSVGNLLLSNSLTFPQTFFAKFQSVVDYEGVRNLTLYNGCINGHAMADLDADITAAIAADGGNPSLAVIMMGMNDQGPAIYNAGQTYPFVYTNLRAAIVRLQNLGCAVIVCTTIHLDTDHATYDLGGGALPQVYPTSIAAPVDPVTQMIPPSTGSVIQFLLGSDIIDIDYRAKRVNEAMRRAAYDTNCAVLDVEHQHFKAIAQYGVTNYANIATSIYGNPSQIVHPAAFGMDVTYGLAGNDFCESLAYTRGADVSGAQNFTRIGLNIETSPTATVHVQQEGASVPAIESRNTSAQLRFEVDENGLLSVYSADGTRFVTFDTNTLLTFGLTFTKGSFLFKDIFSTLDSVSGNQDIAVPASTAGELFFLATNGTSNRQRARYYYDASASVVTVITAIYDTNTGGAVISSVTASSLNIRLACASAGTFIRYRLETNT